MTEGHGRGRIKPVSRKDWVKQRQFCHDNLQIQKYLQVRSNDLQLMGKK
jgi:hypothetical protein